jgi:hypothetical protein
MEAVFSPQPEDRFDVVIKSSDDKLLHLHAITLMHHSKVFRAIEDLGATKEPIAIDYTAEDLTYFFELMYNGVQSSTLEDILGPPDTPIDSAIRLAVQYDCQIIAARLVGVCFPYIPEGVHSPDSHEQQEDMLFNMLDTGRACSVINMAHGCGLTKSVENLLEGLTALISTKPMCCTMARANWRAHRYSNLDSCPFNCTVPGAHVSGWRSEGYLQASRIKSECFDNLNSPVAKMLLTYLFHQVRDM